jgi:hypothetical protein
MTSSKQNNEFRTAVCISGQPRFFEQGFEYINKNLIIPNNADVFIHCWYDDSKNGIGFDSSRWAAAGSAQAGTDLRIQDLYKPKKIIIEPEKNPNPTNRKWKDFNKNLTQADPRILFSMFYSIMRANDLKREYEQENDFTYDAVARIRFDAALMSPVIMREYDLGMLNSLNIINNPGVICDWLNFANSDIMDQYSDVYNKIEEYWDKDNIKMAGENLATYNLAKRKIGVSKHNISMLLLRDGKPDPKFGQVF